jgi:hypothetical protein
MADYRIYMENEERLDKIEKDITDMKKTLTNIFDIVDNRLVKKWNIWKK